MHYQISRNGQTYGPYTLDDLRRYLGTGNVLSTDLAKSDEMPDWLPVSQILDQQNTAPSLHAAGSRHLRRTRAPRPPLNPAFPSSSYPPPPNLHWGLVILFTCLSCYLFMPIWNLVITAWLKRVQPDSKALTYYIGAYGLMVADWVLSVATAVMLLRSAADGFNAATLLRILVGLAIWGLRLVARFMERQSLEDHYNGPEPMGLRLSPVMVFFFGGVYFQYHLNRINALKQAAIYGAPRGF